jgi:uncharacterized low-complexity protein
MHRFLVQLHPKVKMKFFQLTAACAAALLATAASATAIPSSFEHAIAAAAPQQLLAREASEGPRGEGKGHRVSDDLSTTVAREASEGPRGEGKGHRVSDDLSTTVAREASEGPRGEGKGHRVSDDSLNGQSAA